MDGYGDEPVSLTRAMPVLLLLLAGCDERTVSTGDRLPVEIGGRTFNLELALTSESRYQGLSDRRQIPPDGGMLFVFPNARELTFVMRKCVVPIDLVYLGPGGHVVSMHRMKTQPYDTPPDELTPYHSGWPAQFAIELAGGTLDRLELKVGQKVRLPLSRLKAGTE
jgi:uncharacterized membrane protein (UPF0127 family)